MLQQRSGWRDPFWDTSVATLLKFPLPGKARSSMNIAEMIKQVPTATVWLWRMEQDVTLHLHNLEMPLGSSLPSPSLTALDQSSFSHPERTGREKGCVWWLEEGGKLPHPAGLLSAGTAMCFPELFLPCPRRDPPVQGWGSAGSHAPGHAPPQGRQWEAGGLWGKGDGRWAQPDQGPLARVKLRDQQQYQGNVCCVGEPTSGSSECCPKRCREAGSWSFCVQKTPQRSTWGWQRCYTLQCWL